MSDSEEGHEHTRAAGRQQGHADETLPDPYGDPYTPAQPRNRRTLSRRGWTLLLSALLAAAFAAVGFTVSVPYVALGPGPLYDTLGEVEGEPVISFQDEDGEDVADELAYETSGTLSLTTVSVADDVTMFSALVRWVSGEYALAPREQYFRPGVPEEEIREENIAQFENSQSAAESAALGLLGYPTDVFVQEVLPDQPADGVLPANAELISIEGAPVETVQDVHDELEGSRPGQTIDVTFREHDEDGDEVGDEQSAPLELGERDDREQGFMGVTLSERADVDFTVDFTLADVGGPSAGVMFALAIVDRMTEDELVGDRHVAGSGEINATGDIGPIGGIGFKIEAADDAGVDVFLVPEQNCAEAAAAGPEDMLLIEVGSLSEAVDALEAHSAGRDVPTCRE
ncbi:YlbL family protein [Haloechinothrix aidingensis]|uniref:YlbL family protein n=1 Tax=Haloechinothrix aidingensis TaxID=2752311 RepID=UPI0031B58520